VRKKNRRFLLYTVVASVLVLTACQAQQIADHIPPILQRTDVQAEIGKAFGPVEQKVAAGDGFLVMSPAQAGGRELAYVAPADGGAWHLAGQRVSLPDAASATLSVDSDMAVVETTKENAPQFTAYKYSGSGLEPTDWYAAKAPDPAVKTGSFVVVNKYLNALWYFDNGQLVKTFRVATGRDTAGPQATWDDYKTNFVTPEGTFKITDFKVNPSYTGFKPGDDHHQFAGGAPDNPIGTRWMGFSVLKGDGAQIWGIHGTSEPDKIGTWVSDGCIRMVTAQVEELFGMLKGQAPALQVVAK
jgi:lipoprotein-anchoring transpeptidase ErfK/SrfK